MDPRRARVIFVTCFALACLVTAAAQQPAPSFKSGTRVVPLNVTVTDAQRRLVPDLTRDDFEVLDNDKPAPIVVFENGTQPISVVVMGRASRPHLPRTFPRLPRPSRREPTRGRNRRDPP